MSDTEDPVFEPVTIDVEPTVPEDVLGGHAVPEPVPVKAKKARKPMSDERKAVLREQLKKGRETSLANRQEKARKKGTFRKAVTLEDREKEEAALEVAQAKIAAAEARKEQKETATRARTEASEAKALAVQLKGELDELKSERSANKARKAKLKDDAAAAAAEAAAKAPPPPPAPVKRVMTGRELSRMMKGL